MDKLTKEQIKLYKDLLTPELIRIGKKEMKKYYGIAELAKELNWTTEKTHVYYRRGKFITPAAMVGNRPLWTLGQITQIVKGDSGE